MNISRRTFFKTGSATAAFFAAKAIGAGDSSRADPADADLLAQTGQRIEEHRKTDLIIRVRRPAIRPFEDHRPIPGARVRVQQLRHDFLFGCNFFMFGRLPDPALEELYRARFAALLNYATLGFYWSAYERERGKPNYSYTEQVTDWCQKHRITCKGHPLAWDHPAGCPPWLPEDFSQIERLSTNRVSEIVSRFQNQIRIWDVVNEPTDLTRFKNPMNTWANHLGAVPFTRLHLAAARAANPQATLLVNDYRNDPAYHKILESLQEQGKPLFNAIGLQSHMHNGGWPLRRIWNVCDAFSSFQVPLHFTETTIVSGPRRGPGENWGATTAEGEAKQADYVPNFYRMLFAHPAVRAITWWDFADLGAWQGAPAGWLRKDMSPKPVYNRLTDLIKHDWWTTGEGHTKADGTFKSRAFYGTYSLTVELPSGKTVVREFQLSRGGPQSLTIVVN